MSHLVLINGTLNKAITAFSWMLIHSLWEGLLLAIIAGAALVLAKKSSAAYRYNLVLILFVTFISLCGFTFVYEWRSAVAGIALSPEAGNATIKASPLFIDVHTVKQLINTFTGYFSANAPLVMMVWFMVFLFKSIRMISSLAYNQRIRNYQVYEPTAYWADKITLFSEKLGINKTVKLLQSGYVKVPVVVGHLKPIILLPVGLLAGLPAEQVEAILLHELAHIRRNDYVVNFLQIVAEAVFFFNPGLLWLSSVLKEERENCCDDVALQQTNDKIGFVQALISFKEHQLYGNAYATAFPGKKNYLMRRVVRILSNDNKLFGRSEKIFFATSILLFGLVVATAAVARIRETISAPVRKEVIARPHAVINTAKITVTKTRTFKRHLNLTAKAKILNDIARADELKAQEDVVNLQLSRQQLASAITNVAKLQGNDLLVRAEQQRKQLEAAKAQTERDNLQADLDRQQAERDRTQAEKDRHQADLDRQQADRDRAQAERDRHQAELDRQQADKDRQQAEKDRARAEIERQQHDARSHGDGQE